MLDSDSYYSAETVLINLYGQILRLFEDSEYWLEMQREKDQVLNGFGSTAETDLWRLYELSSVGTLALYDT